MPSKGASLPPGQLKGQVFSIRSDDGQSGPRRVEEIRYAYRLSQVGHLGVNLLHDLANNVTALTLELESLQQKSRSPNIANLKQIISYLDEIVSSTRDQLRGAVEPCRFDLKNNISKSVSYLAYKADRAGVRLKWEPPAVNPKCYGHPIYICQVMIALVGNAIEAYTDSRAKDKRVVVTLRQQNKSAIIKVCDWGSGIPTEKRKCLFKPFYTTKDEGLGVGLFLAKQTIEGIFGGTIWLNTKSAHTEFVAKIPLN